jgi:transposase
MLPEKQSYLNGLGMKQWRRIATRYEKRAVNYGGMLTLAAMILWL